MSIIVVDASVGVKWFVPEVHAAQARQWRHGPDTLHAPAFFDLEIAAQAPGTETPLERLLELDPTMELPYIRSLEDASGLAPHELFEGVLAEGDSYCFETPKAVWSAR